MYNKFLILVKLNIIYGTEKFLINLDFDYNFTLSGLIPYIANIIGVGKDAGDNLILLDSNKEILSPNCKIIELIIMSPNKYNSITVKLNKSYKTKSFESKGLSQCISSNYLQRTNEKTLRNENYYENKKYFEPNSKEIDISEINYDKISPSYSEIISNINNTHSLGNNMHIDEVRERDKREKSPCNETNKTNRKSKTYSSDGFSYYKSKYNYPQSDLYSDLSEKILDKNKIYKKNEGQEFATFAENMDENVKFSNLKIYNNKFDIEKNNYDYSKNYFYDKKDHTEERRLKTQIKVKNNYSSKTKNKIEEYNSFEENNDYEAFPQDDPSNKYNYSPVSREKLTLEDNEFPNKSKVASEKRNFRDREEIRIVNSVNEINNKPRRLIEDKNHSREQEIMDIRERYEKKMKNNGIHNF
jgi:hypothetical protein